LRKIKVKKIDPDERPAMLNKITKAWLRIGQTEEAARINAKILNSLSKISFEQRKKACLLASEIAVSRRDYQKALEMTRCYNQYHDSLQLQNQERRKAQEEKAGLVDEYMNRKLLFDAQRQMTRLMLQNEEMQRESLKKQLQAARAEAENSRLRIREMKNRQALLLEKEKVESREKTIRSMQIRDSIATLLIANDSINKVLEARKLALLQREKENLALQAEKRQRRNLYLTIIALLSLVVMAGLFRSLRKERSLNELLSQQKAIIEADKKQLEETLQKLKDAQYQLVESSRLPLSDN